MQGLCDNGQPRRTRRPQQRTQQQLESGTASSRRPPRSVSVTGSSSTSCGPNLGQPCGRVVQRTASLCLAQRTPRAAPVPAARLLSQQAEKELRQLTQPFPADLGGPLQSKPGYPPPSPAHPSPPSPLSLQSGQSLAMCSVVAPCQRRHLSESRSSLIF